ncbi:DEAD/DEAH box helicase [Rhodopirellula europaea]|uniref:SNF2-like protein n=2 Tax=Rhodopirellula europaea TaxID=1263866 RepID=M2APH2_9BACT|nr:DEAD/DEAH box helicase [Rhodopirellula europaea]EMB14632.1 SNF2-like protein [Rhodopirellula europaea 6C]EMI25520.1 SNF2-related protein [Rhodopirellula europaea SH398]|tara:strand:- start:11558 stop:15088 length:3531 start_codon:yes stop_codon:yes gene_type:complete
MDWIAEDQLGSLGLLMGEAVERLVDSHDQGFDSRAAMLTVKTPTLTQGDNGVRFDFQVVGNREKQQNVALEIVPQVDEDDPGGVGELSSECQCGCVAFLRDNSCPHTLAAAWWLQEQIARRNGNGQLIEFLGGLKADAVAAGKQFVDELLRRAKNSRPAPAEDAEPTRLQWRVRVNMASQTAPLTITPFEQKQRKGGKGWTKGREVRSFDLLDQNLLTDPLDSKIASLTSVPTHGVHDDNYAIFEALRMLAGHENVAWDDQNALPVEVFCSQLLLTLQPVEVEQSKKPKASKSQTDGEASKKKTAAKTTRKSSGKRSGKSADELLGNVTATMTMPESELDSVEAPSADGLIPDDLIPDEEKVEVQFQPRLSVDGIDINVQKCEIVVGGLSPVEPAIILADSDEDRIVLCTLADPAAIGIIQFLLRGDYRDTLLDHATASRLALAAGSIDSLIRVELPPQLAGPIVPAPCELVLQMRPRPGAGLKVSLRVYESRLRDSLIPGDAPELVPCLAETGPIRLQRDLKAELESAEKIVQRFGLSRLSHESTMEWVALTDHAALDLLGRLHDAGDESPRIVWPEGETFRVRGEITPKSLRIKIDDSPDWFGMTGTVTVDGVDVPLQDLLMAVREDRQLVRVGDRRFAKISEAFRKRLTQLGDTLVSEKGQLRLAGAAVPLARDVLGDDVTLETTAAWHQAIERLDSLQDWSPDRPDGLDATLRDYQLDGYRWLARLSRWGVGGVLADDMGLGKTVQTLGILVERGPTGPALVVAPTSVGENWVREAEKFTPALTGKLYRDCDRDEVIKTAGPNDLLIVSYQLLQRDAKRFASRSWHTLVLDEAQFIKNSQTKTSQAIRTIQADWRLGLSGTPLENHLGELWSLFRTLSPGLLGSWQRFRSRFAEPIERHSDADRRESLARLVRPFVLRRTKDKVLKELPPRTEITLRAELSAPERKLYEDARLAALAELTAGGGAPSHEGRRRIQTLSWLTRLRQLACHPSLVEPSWKGTSSKLQLFLSLVEELREGDHRALVFSQFVKHLSVVRAALDERGISYQYLDGATPSHERQRRVDAFQNGEGDLFLISLKAGGTGLNLTAADYVLHLDPWWNPAVEDQATDRAHRIGQERAVTVYRLVAERTIEEQILQLHADKRELVAGILDGTDAAAKLQTQDLIDLIKAEMG